MSEETQPLQIEVIGGQVNNLKNINVNVPLHRFVGICGLSGSGKSSLAMGILYAEGARRYLDALSTYTRRRISQVGQSKVKMVKHLPAALALRQRPSIPGVRSTVGTMTELFNMIRLIYSRLGSPVCPNGHRLTPSLRIAQVMAVSGDKMGKLTCPVCGTVFSAFSAEDFAFNGAGACQECQGLGQIKRLDPEKLIDDPTKTIAEGAIAAWRIPGRNFMPFVARTAGIRIDMPFNELSKKEKDFVLHGEKKTYPTDIPSKNGRVFHLNALYENAYDAVKDSMKTTKSERGLKRLDTFYRFSTCPRCHGSRLDPSRLTQLVDGKTIADAACLTLGQIPDFCEHIVQKLPQNMKELARTLTQELVRHVSPLLELGLSYLRLDREGASLSTGELQRIQLGRTLRTQTTGVLYVLDEPSVGLHPENLKGLIHVLRALVAQGNSLVVVDHETDLLNAADWLIEIGPGSGSQGGRILAQGTPQQLSQDPNSVIGPYLIGKAPLQVRSTVQDENVLWQEKPMSLSISDRFNLHDFHVRFPRHRLTALTGFSGAGKTTLLFDALLPALKASAHHEKGPDYVKTFDAAGVTQAISVDAAPIGKNQRSTLATYTPIMTALRRLYAAQPLSKKRHYTATTFSYNQSQGACPTCGGTGTLTLDIQYLPDFVETCPTCHGKRYDPKVLQVVWQGHSIADVLALSVHQALTSQLFVKIPIIERTLTTLADMGLGYLHLGEATPALSGGEAQRLKLSSRMHQSQEKTLFVFDEPTVGLHPQDVRTLVHVFDRLLKQGATLITITHDLDLMSNADYLIDLGPKGGDEGGRLMAKGLPWQLAQHPVSATTHALARHFASYHQN